jgi:hypothetical protein
MYRSIALNYIRMIDYSRTKRVNPLTELRVLIAWANRLLNHSKLKIKKNIGYRY